MNRFLIGVVMSMRTCLGGREINNGYIFVGPGQVGGRSLGP
jgi:hypothetical protein